MRGPLPCNLPMRMKRKDHPTETPRRGEAPLAARGVTGTAHGVTRPRGGDGPSMPHPAELEAIYATAPIGLALLSTDLRFLRLNSRFAEFGGISVEDCLGRTVQELAPDRAAAAEMLARRIIESGEPARGAAIIGKTATGPGARTNHVESWLPLKDGDGRVTGISIIAEEITSTEHAGRALQAAHDELRDMLESISDAFYALDQDLRISYVNRRAAMLWKMRPEDILGRPFAEIFPQVLGTKTWAEHLRVNEARQPAYLESISNISKVWVGRNIYPRPGGGVSVYFRDISERKHAEQALRDSEERLRAAVDAAEVGTWRIDLQTGEDRWDASLNRIVGLPAAQTSRHASESYPLIHPEDRAMAREAWRRFVEDGAPYDVDFRLQRPDGELRWVRDRGQIVHGPDGAPLYATGAVVDVTRRKLAEEKVRESEAQFRTLADSIPQLAWMAEPSGAISWYNQRWYDYTGATPEQMAGWGWRSLHDPAVLPHVLQRWRTSIATGVPFEMVFPLRGADGVFRPFLTRGAPLRDGEGRVTQWFGTNTDITAQRAAEFELRRLAETLEARVAARTAELHETNRALTNEIAERERAEAVLRESEQRYRELYNRTPMALHSIDAHAKLIDVNDHWLQLFGYRREEVLGHSPAEFMDESSARRFYDIAWPEMLDSKGTTLTYEYRFVKHSGEVFDGRVSAQGERDATGRFVRTWAVIADITLQKQAEEQLRQAQKMEAVGQLTSGVAHDFNNVLAAVIGNLELLQREVESERGKRLLRGATRAGERGAKLTEQLLAFARKQHLAPKPFDVNALIVGMEEMLSRVIGPDLQVEKRLAGELWPALADPSQIEVAILNLALNAHDAMPGGGLLTLATANRPDGHPQLPAELAGDFVVITVADTGVGMTDQVLARAFEPFFTTKDVGKGTGLGLSMVYGVAKQSGGAVTIVSSPGKGTTVSLFLPRAPAVRAVEPTSRDFAAARLGKRSG